MSAFLGWFVFVLGVGLHTYFAFAFRLGFNFIMSYFHAFLVT